MKFRAAGVYHLIDGTYVMLLAEKIDAGFALSPQLTDEFVAESNYLRIA